MKGSTSYSTTLYTDYSKQEIKKKRGGGGWNEHSLKHFTF
jgi:hypothetical protein